MGPFKLQWEAAQDEQVKATCCDLGLPDDDEARVCAQDLNLKGESRVGRVRAWFSRESRHFGRSEFSVAGVRAAVKMIVQQGRVYSVRDEPRLLALTIHQAKNREFDRVIVLWPYGVSGNDERKRRLAYNAITRARHEATVIVQSEARVAQSPFISDITAAPKSDGTGKKREH